MADASVAAVLLGLLSALHGMAALSPGRTALCPHPFPTAPPTLAQQVARWESLHYNECGQPTLLRFRGRPDELSPLARLSSWLGGPLPFDRHDW